MVVVVKEYFSARGFGYQRPRRDSNYFHDGGHLVVLIFASEQWNSYQAFEDNAAEAPHVNGGGVRDTQHDFRCPVKPGLDVGVEAF